MQETSKNGRNDRPSDMENAQGATGLQRYRYIEYKVVSYRICIIFLILMLFFELAIFFFFYFKIQKITYFCGSAIHCAMTSGSFKKTCVDVFIFNMFNKNKTEAEQFSNTIMNIDINMEKSTFYV